MAYFSVSRLSFLLHSDYGTPPRCNIALHVHPDYGRRFAPRLLNSPASGEVFLHVSMGQAAALRSCTTSPPALSLSR